MQLTVDHDRGQTIPDEIYAGASHVHQFIDTKDDCHTNRPETGRQEAVQRCKKNNQGCARHRGYAFGRDHQCEHHHDLPIPANVLTGGGFGRLRDEDRSHRQVKSRAIKVK